MSGERVQLIGPAMARIVEGIRAASTVLPEQPVIVGGIAVLSRLANPYRATEDIDIVDRLQGTPHLELLRATNAATAVEPSGVELKTRLGNVRVDVLEVRQVELDVPSDNPGDRLHASSHAWAYDTASAMTLTAVTGTEELTAVARVAQPGPLVAMKLQSVMDRGQAKQGTDLLDVVRLTLDIGTSRPVDDQIRRVASGVAADITRHVDLWFGERRAESLRRIHQVGGRDVTIDDLDLVADLLRAAASR